MKLKLDVSIEKVNPQLASEWLANRLPEQRKVREAHVKRLASDMSLGKFKVSFDCIGFINDRLANGQHRLEALVLSGKPQSFIVLRTNDIDLFKVTDAGIKRQVSDGLHGVNNALVVAAASRWVRNYELGILTVNAHSSHGAEYKRAGHAASQIELIEYAEDHKDILQECATFCHSLYQSSRLIPSSITTALMVIAADKGHKKEAESFITSLYNGEGNSSSAHDMRNRLIVNKGARAKLPAGYMFALILKAFKSYLNGTRPGSLKINDSEELTRI